MHVRDKAAVNEQFRSVRTQDCERNLYAHVRRGRPVEDNEQGEARPRAGRRRRALPIIIVPTCSEWGCDKTRAE